VEPVVFADRVEAADAAADRQVNEPPDAHWGSLVRLCLAPAFSHALTVTQHLAPNNPAALGWRRSDGSGGRLAAAGRP